MGIYVEKSIIWKDTYTLIFIAILFTIARSWKQHNCPSTEEWIKKARYIHRMEYHSVIKKGQNNTICSNMDGPEDCHIEWSKADFRFHWKVFNVPLTGTLVLYLLQKRRNSIEGITHFSAISSPVILIYVKQFKGQWVGRRKGFKLYNVKWKSHFACVLCTTYCTVLPLLDVYMLYFMDDIRNFVRVILTHCHVFSCPDLKLSLCGGLVLLTSAWGSPSLASDSVSWADPCTWLTLLSGPALCSASPTPGLSPPVHKLPAQVTAFASPSSSCVTRPLASSSLLLQHSVDCLTHRKWQVNISCTELICTWLHLLLLLCPWDGAMGDSLSLRQQPPRPPSQWIWASPLWRPLTRIFYSVYGQENTFLLTNSTLSLF